MNSTLPPPYRRRTLLFGFAPVGRRWPSGARAALALGLPAMAALALGYEHQAFLMVSGAFAVVYGEGKPYRARWSVILVAGASLVFSAWLGALAGQLDLHLGDAKLVAVLTLTVIAAAATYVVAALRLGPPGAFFPVLVCAISTQLPNGGIHATEVAFCAAIGVAAALLIGMSGVVKNPHKPEVNAVDAAVSAVAQYTDSGLADGARHAAGSRIQNAWITLHDARVPARGPSSPLVVTLLDAHQRFARAALRQLQTGDPELDYDLPYDPAPVSNQIPLARPSASYRLRRSLHVDSHASTTAFRVALASLLAGGICVVLGLDRPDWAVLGAVLVLNQGPERIVGTIRGVHRLLGTAAGVILFAGIFELRPIGFWLVVCLMILQFLIELFIARNYGVAVLFITPLALLIGSSARPDAVLSVLVLDRLIETALGVALAFVALWTFLPHSFRRGMLWSDNRVLDAAAETSAFLARHPPSSTESLPLRRDVQFELVGSALAGADAAHNDREWAQRHWDRHTEIGRVGYDLLAKCWATPAGVLLESNEDLSKRIDTLRSGADRE